MTNADRDLPLVIRYEPVQIDGLWAVRRRTVYQGDTDRTVGPTRWYEERDAQAHADSMQYASDFAESAWKNVVARMSEE